jgi:hypothetical protein
LQAHTVALARKLEQFADVAGDHLGINMLDPNPWAMPLEPPPQPSGRASVQATYCGLTPLARPISAFIDLSLFSP